MYVHTMNGPIGTDKEPCLHSILLRIMEGSSEFLKLGALGFSEFTFYESRPDLA